MKFLAIVALILGASSPALAFHEVESFARTANRGGGNGNYFSGSPLSKGYDCHICHVDAEQRIRIEIESPLSSGSYRAGLIYPVTLRLIGEHRGLESAFNPNTFTAQVTDDSGQPIGQLAGGGDRVVEFLDGGTTAIAEGFGNGESEWRFTWWAPEDAAPATLHVAMLDGDGASDPVRRFIDPLNDDIATLELRLCPEEGPCPALEEPAPERSPAGCSSTAGKAGDAGGSLLLLLLLLIACRTGRCSSCCL